MCLCRPIPWWLRVYKKQKKSFVCFLSYTRQVKVTVLHKLLERISSKEELKYGVLALKLFKKQRSKIHIKEASLFLKVG